MISPPSSPVKVILRGKLPPKFRGEVRGFDGGWFCVSLGFVGWLLWGTI